MKHKRIRIVLIILAILILGMGIGMKVYLSDYYHAGEGAISLIESEDSSIQKEEGRLIFEARTLEAENKTAENKSTDGETADNKTSANENVTGIIFYPGGKVAYEAYAPLMNALADKGFFCVLVEMPGNLAVFDMNAAEKVKNEYPEITDWYLGGHSLGGAMAASYISKHTEEYKGLFLLGAYSTEDLSDSGLKVLTIYGSEDGVMNREHYEEDIPKLPEDFKEYVIEGGCHAYFGDYGAQDGDGTPTISQEEQVALTAEYIAKEFLNQESVEGKSKEKGKLHEPEIK